MGLFRIKICGITSAAEASGAVAAGADAIGLNLFSGGRRLLSTEEVHSRAAAVSDGVTKVGIFVNRPISDIFRACDAVNLDLIHLPGDEPPEFLAEIQIRRI